MNKKQRKDLEDIKAKIDELLNEVQFMSDEENDKWNNATESLQQTEKFKTIESIASALDSAVGSLKQAASDVDEALSY